MASVVHTLGDLAERLGATLRGDSGKLISGLATLQEAGPEQLSFLANAQYRKYLAGSTAGAVLLTAKDAADYAGMALIVDNPYLAYARLSHLFETRPQTQPGIHPSAIVDPSAHVDPTACIAPNVVIEADAWVGPGVVIGAQSFVGARSRIGAGGRLAARVTLCHDVYIGERVVIQPGAVIGEKASASPTSRVAGKRSRSLVAYGLAMMSRLAQIPRSIAERCPIRSLAMASSSTIRS